MVAAARIAVGLGEAVRTERRRRGMSLRELGAAAGLSASAVHAVESGRRASLETYARIGVALHLRLDATLDDGRASSPGAARSADAVHAAMGEVEAAHLRRLGHVVRIDEPYQHYQFAGRADVVAVDLDRRALLHLENKTRLPDIQELAGSFGAKKAYLGPVLAARFGLRAGFASETHVLVGLWSADVLHVLRVREESFRALCPDEPLAFETWWAGGVPPVRTASILVLLDPAVASGSRARAFVSGGRLAAARPRYHGYADALDAVRARRRV